MKDQRLAALSVLALQASSAIAQQSPCVDDWSEAAPIEKREEAAARDQVSGEIVKTTLCRDGERWVYRLVVGANNGQFRTTVVDAKTPFAR